MTIHKRIESALEDVQSALQEHLEMIRYHKDDFEYLQAQGHADAASKLRRVAQHLRNALEELNK